MRREGGGKQPKFRYGHGSRSQQSKKHADATPTITSDIVEELRICAQELEEKQDRHERIVKISRDVTIDSKRLIFYLHTFQKGTPDAETVLTEARTRLIRIVQSLFFNLAKELKNLDIYQFTRAYTFGIQEFIEAFSFYHYLVYDNLLTYEDVKEFLVEHMNAHVDSEDGSTCSVGIDSQNSDQKDSSNQWHFVTMLDYVLGLSDLTGELMRYSINQVAAGRNQIAFDTCRFLTNLYTGMLSVDSHSRDFNRKMYTFLQSVQKVEMACYTVKVRGTEMPKHMIFSVLDNEDEPDDVNF